MPLNIVYVDGSKGGCSKTTTSHAIAAGVREFGGHGVYALTDSRMQLSSENRWYDIVDARAEEAMREYVGRAKAFDGCGIFVIDGAGSNSPEVDAWYASLADLVLLPMTPDEDSTRTVALDVARLDAAGVKNILVLPSRWSTNAKAAEVDQDYINMIKHFVGADRVLPPLPQVHSVAEFVRSDFNGTLLPTARSFCRLLTGAVIGRLQDQGVWL